MITFGYREKGGLTFQLLVLWKEDAGKRNIKNHLYIHTWLVKHLFIKLIISAY